MARNKVPECVELQDRGALVIYEITKNMTREEELAYWKERTEALRQEQVAVRAEQQRKPS